MQLSQCYLWLIMIFLLYKIEGFWAPFSCIYDSSVYMIPSYYDPLPYIAFLDLWILQFLFRALLASPALLKCS